MKRAWPILVALFCIVYLLNPTLGFFELIPDNIPWIGNLDEATAAILLVWAVKRIFGKGDEPPPSIRKPPEKTVN